MYSVRYKPKMHIYLAKGVVNYNNVSSTKHLMLFFYQTILLCCYSYIEQKPSIITKKYSKSLLEGAKNHLLSFVHSTLYCFIWTPFRIRCVVASSLVLSNKLFKQNIKRTRTSVSKVAQQFWREGDIPTGNYVYIQII